MRPEDVGQVFQVGCMRDAPTARILSAAAAAYMVSAHPLVCLRVCVD